MKDQIQDRERRQRELQAKLSHLDMVSKLPIGDLPKELRAMVGEWRKLLDAHRAGRLSESSFRR